jgi:hypothetical protein
MSAVVSICMQRGRVESDPRLVVTCRGHVISKAVREVTDDDRSSQGCGMYTGRVLDRVTDNHRHLEGEHERLAMGFRHIVHPHLTAAAVPSLRAAATRTACTCEGSEYIVGECLCHLDVIINGLACTSVA